MDSGYLPQKIYEMSREQLIEEIERIRRQNHALRTVVCSLQKGRKQKPSRRGDILYRWHSGESIKKIAADVGCSIANVYKTIHKEKAALST